MALQHLRSGTAHKRPIPTVMSAGQIAINTNEASPGLFFKDSNGDLVKVGPVHIGTTAPNSSPDSVAATALVTGTVYQILTVGTSDFTLVGASANTVGTIFTATGTTTGTGTVSGQQGVEKGEQWLDTTGGNYVLKIYDGTAWRSEAGEFVNVSGDTMTGALLLDNAASVSAPDLSFDGDANTGIYSPGADQFGVATAGTAALTIDSSQRVGIGSTSPAANLDVLVNSASDSEVRVRNNTDGLRLMMQADGTSLIRSVFNRGIIFGSGTSNADTTLAERMRIDSSGRVGVGTTSADRLLHVEGAGTSGTQVQIEGTSASAGLKFVPASGDNWELQATTDSALLVYNRTDAAERMRIDSSGNVGIGTSSPASFGKFAIRSHAGTIDAVPNVTAHIADGSNSALYVGHSSGLVQLVANSALSFGYTNGSTNSERMRIDSSGKVGIGTSSPSALLHCDYTGTRVGSTIGHIATTSHGDASDYTLFKVSNFQGSSENTKFFIRGDGNVGIGTTSPSQALDVVGWVKTDTGFLGTYGRFTTSSSDGPEITTGAFANSIKFIGGNGATNIERARIDSSGRLLVGTSSARTNFNTGGNTAEFQVEGVGKGSFMRNLNDQYGSDLFLTKSRSTGNSIVSNNDIVGNISFQGNDGTHFVPTAIISAQIDGTPGSNDMPGRLVFSTTADGASSPTARLRINSAGTVLPETDNAYYLGVGSNRWIAVYAANGTIQTSDRREKTEIQTSALGIDFIKSLKPVSYKWNIGQNIVSKSDDGETDVITPRKGVRRHWGFIAQDVEEAVNKAGVDFGGWLLEDKDDPGSRQALRYDQFIAPLTKALQEAIAKIETLEAKVAALESA